MLRLNNDKSFHRNVVKNADNSNIEEKTWKNNMENFNYLEYASKAEVALEELNKDCEEIDDELEFYKVDIGVGVVYLLWNYTSSDKYTATFYEDKDGNTFELIYDNGVFEGENSSIMLDDYDPISSCDSSPPSMGQTYYYIENEQVKSKVWKNDFQDKVRYSLDYKLYTSASEANAELGKEQNSMFVKDKTKNINEVTYRGNDNILDGYEET